MASEQDTGFLDYLDDLKNRKQLCTIRFRSVEGSVSEIRAHIVDLLHEGHRAIIETDAGFGIGVDQLIAVNGRPAGNIC